MKSTSVSKREVAQHLEDKENAENLRDEAVREQQRLRREMDELQVHKVTLLVINYKTPAILFKHKNKTVQSTQIMGLGGGWDMFGYVGSWI